LLRVQTAHDPFLGRHPGIAALAREAMRYAESDHPILIQGETGTGKGILARWLHDHSRRRSERFVDLNCACFDSELIESELFGHERGAFTGALSPKQGLLEVANDGSIFLDEIGDMALRVQPKLLKVIEERRMRRLGEVRERLLDVRLISATHQDLSSLAAERRFRSDLLFRINTIVITLPPLRERGNDILDLARALARQGSGQEIHFTADAEQRLLAHNWPGNIRELRNVLDRALLFAEGAILTGRDLDPAIAASPACPLPPRTMQEWERVHILEALEREHGHVPAAAARLGIPRSSLYKKLKRLADPPTLSTRASIPGTGQGSDDPN
jgi:DNA-binding NtrC family response regulator